MAVKEWVNTSDNSEWATPQKLFDALDFEFCFTLDPCASHDNHKCKKYYTIEDNGLVQNWDGETVFMNPPYHRHTADWVRKAASTKGTVVALLPARTDTNWFHDYILGKAEIRYLKHRLRYNDGKGYAPFASMIVIWRNTFEVRR